MVALLLYQYHALTVYIGCLCNTPQDNLDEQQPRESIYSDRLGNKRQTYLFVKTSTQHYPLIQDGLLEHLEIKSPN